MDPRVRGYADPYEGLVAQLTELRGLIKIVPPLIEADRQRRWDEIGSRPGDPDEEMIDVYEHEAGAEEGWGFAEFDRTIYIAAVVTAWEVFRECLVRQLKDRYLSYDLSQHRPLATLVQEETRLWDRRFDRIEQRYKDFAGIKVATWKSWDSVRHAHELRNALTHNLGQYTSAYLKTKLAYRPTSDDLHGFVPPGGDDGLINRVSIPLSTKLVDEVIAQLIAVAGEVRDAIGNQ
jgi:hypothetical protein